MIKGADNINRKPYLGSTEIKQAWLGNILVYPETLYGLKKYSNLGDIVYYYDMGDGIHFATKSVNGYINIYRYDEKYDDKLLYSTTNTSTYIMQTDGFFYYNGVEQKKLYRFDANDNLEEWTKTFEENILISEMLKFNGNYYARMTSNSSTATSYWYPISLDFENKIISRTNKTTTISSYLIADDKVYWDRCLNEDNRTIRFYNDGLGVFTADSVKISSVLKNSLGTYLEWSWVGRLNNGYYGVGEISTGTGSPALYTIDVNKTTWTRVSLKDISGYVGYGAIWQKIKINNEEMLYITCLSSKSSNYTYIPGVSYLLRIVDGQPVIKKYENNPYMAISQFADNNLFIASGFSDSSTIYKTYVVKFDENFDFVLVDDVDEYTSSTYTNNTLLPVWKFKNKAYLFGRPFKYINEE